MNLDLVLGMSCNNISCLACDRNSSLAAHTASGVLVLLDTATNCQVRYLHLRQNTVSSANFSPDGKFIVTGEIGYRPAVRVWKVKDGQELAALYGHEFGIKSVLFCANMTHIISVGLEHDNEVNLWAWPEKHRLATNKIVDIIKAVAYSDCGSYFVTAGIRHLKFWYPELSLGDGASSTVIPLVQCLYGRPGILGDCKQHTFVDVACGNGTSSDFVYCITRNGGLVIVRASSRLVHSHKNIEDWKSNCLKVQDQILFIGFSNGDVHMFDAISLHHLAALPAPTFFRQTCMNGGGVFTLVFNPSTTLLTTAYKNSSMCVWDLRNARNVKQKYVAVYHCKAITNFDIFTTKGPGGQVRETLVTVSHDSTVRLWGVIIGNTICYDRLSILYTESTPQHPVENQNATLDNSGIITAVKVSPNKKFIVTGNKAGNICVYDRITFEHSLTVLAHSREVTCLAMHTDSSKRTVLASGSRDRLIHIMDVNNEFRLISTLSIHSSSITVISLCEMSGTVNMISCAADRTISICTAPIPGISDYKHAPVFQLSKCTTIMSTPTDICIVPFTKQISVGCQDGYIRVLDMEMLQEVRMFRGCTCEERQIHKLCLDAKGALLLTAASDKTINVISFATGDILVSLAGHTKCVTGLVFTSSGSRAFQHGQENVCTDFCVCLRKTDAETYEMLQSAFGDHVISTSMDGCVFIWHISEKTLRKHFLKAKKQNLLTEETSVEHDQKMHTVGAPKTQGDREQSLGKKAVTYLKWREKQHCQPSGAQSACSNNRTMMTTTSNNSINKVQFFTRSATQLSRLTRDLHDFTDGKSSYHFKSRSDESQSVEASPACGCSRSENTVDRLHSDASKAPFNIHQCLIHNQISNNNCADLSSMNISGQQQVIDDKPTEFPRTSYESIDKPPTRKSSSSTWCRSMEHSSQHMSMDKLHNTYPNKVLKSGKCVKQKAKVKQQVCAGGKGTIKLQKPAPRCRKKVIEKDDDDDDNDDMCTQRSLQNIYNSVEKCPAEGCLLRSTSHNFLHTLTKPVH